MFVTCCYSIYDLFVAPCIFVFDVLEMLQLKDLNYKNISEWEIVVAAKEPRLFLPEDCLKKIKYVAFLARCWMVQKKIGWWVSHTHRIKESISQKH